MQAIISIKKLSKTYSSGYQALKNVSLDVAPAEIIALLGSNGAGKTTLISIICGIVNPTEGKVLVDGYDIVKDFRQSRRLIGLVPQELTLGAFDTVWHTVNFSRGLFGKKKNNKYLKQLLQDLSLWDKKESEIRSLSGGMKRRVLIAKALSHEPKILFLDEPTAGVDVELRKDMWAIVRKLRDTGVTIILTTHYIEEAEEIADRVGIISHGELLLVEEKKKLMQKLGKKLLEIELTEKINKIPECLNAYGLKLSEDGLFLIYSYDTRGEGTGITALLQAINSTDGLGLKDIKTSQSSLEDIFVDILKEDMQ